MVKHSIGQKIRDLRQAKEYTLKNMGDKLGISTSAYAKIERDETDPQASRLMGIAKLLGVEVGYFFIVDRTSKRYTPKVISVPKIEALEQTVALLKKEYEQLKKEVARLKK
jgi:transcriptional regulator with XRE-family HTH domain